jgi:nitrite transporter NirC
MTMAFGLYNNKVKFSSALRVCIMSYIGNFIGTFILGGLLVLSGCASEVLTDYYSAIIPGKLELDPLTLFIRGVLCNYLVCLAVFIGTRMKTESGKLVVMFCIITAFVIAGFEHCIANMGIFTIAAFLLGGLPTQEVINNFIFVTLGNIFGGTILFALPLQIVTKRK